MKPSQLISFLSRTIPARLPVLIVGAPGIGKSDLVAQAAAAAGADLIISHPAVADPTDVKGLPWVAKGAEHATFLPFGELARALKATTPTVWFLDDLGQAPPSVQASFMQLLLARRVNGHVLPDCVTFLAASNRRTDRAGVSGILEPVKSRFVAIVELEPDLDEWTQWALGQDDMPPELVAFLRFRPELLSAFVPSADLTNCPLPRTWAHAGKLLALDLPDNILLAAVAGAVGQGAAIELMAFLRMFRELPNIDAILLDPDGPVIPKDPAALYAVTTALAVRTTVENFAAVARYAQRLVDALHGEFATLLIRDAVRRTPSVTDSPAFIRLAAGEIGQLIGGIIQ
jgi:hypothetical protein